MLLFRTYFSPIFFKEHIFFRRKYPNKKQKHKFYFNRRKRIVVKDLGWDRPTPPPLRERLWSIGIGVKK